VSDTTTPNLGLVQPDVGASRSTWGGKWNNNASLIDSNAGSLQSQITSLQNQINTLNNEIAVAGAPIGAIMPWPIAANYPGGYLICDGSIQNVSSYPKLFNVLGAHFGGNGSTTFALPDFRGCVPCGCDEGTGRLGGQISPDTPGVIGGAAVIALSVAQMPAHSHTGYTDAQGAHQHNYNHVHWINGAGVNPGSYFTLGDDDQVTDVQGNHQHNVQTYNSGSGAGITNVQASVLVYWLIRAA
jgi:microcystin-dependent protein